MKKIIKIMCMFVILSICTIGVFAADSDIKSEQAAQHAAFCRQQMDIRKNVLKNHYTDDKVSLMSYYQLPSTFKKLAEKVTIYNSEDIYEEIYFAQSSDSYWFEAVLYSVEDRCFIEDSYVAVDSLYDDYDRCTGVYIDYVDAWNLEPGEYYIYIIDEYENYYEPISFIVNSFEMYDTTFSTSEEYTYMYMNMEKTDIHYNGKILESITLEGFDENNRRAFLLSNLPVSYASVYDLEVSVKFPSHLYGKYNMSIILNYTDGTKATLGQTKVNIGDYLMVERMYTENSIVTPNTKNISAFVNLTKPLEAGEKIKLVMRGMDSGKIIAQSSDYKLAEPEYFNDISFVFDINLASPVNEDIIFNIEYEGNRELINPYNGYIEFSETAVFDVKSIGNNKYSMKTDGIKPGVYDVKLYDYYGEKIGELTVDSDENGIIKTDGSNIEHNTLYLESESASYSIRMESVEYERNSIKLPYIENITPKYIMYNSVNINNMNVNIVSDRIYSEDDISIKLYDYNGKKIAEATDIKVNNTRFDFNEFASVMSNIEFSFKNLQASFSTEGALTVVIGLGDKYVTEEIYVADDDTFGCSTDIQLKDAGYKFGGIVKDEYYYNETCYNTSKDKAAFSIKWTNRFLEYAELYKYNPVTCEFELYSIKNASQLVANNSTYGNGYSYDIEFAVSQEGIYRMVTDESQSELVYVTNKYFVYNDYEFLNVVEDKYNYMYFESAGLRSGYETFGAYYINSYGQKINIPITYDYGKDYVDITFDFTNIRNFGYMCVYITCNGEDAGSVMAYDKRDGSYNVEIYPETENGEWILYAYGYGLDNIDSPVMNICKVEKIDNIQALTSPIKTKAISFSYGYSEISIEEFNLEPGIYYAYITSGGRMVSAVSPFMTTDKTTEVNNMPVKITNANVEYGYGNIIAINTDTKAYNNAVVILAAYDENGEIMDIKMENVQIKPESLFRAYPEISEGAYEYKFFIFENNTSIKPLAKIY